MLEDRNNKVIIEKLLLTSICNYEFNPKYLDNIPKTNNIFCFTLN